MARPAGRPRSRVRARRACNPLAGGIALADVVVVVSPTYREEVLRPETGAGLDALLRERADALVGIRNGIDAERLGPFARPAHPCALRRARPVREGACADGPARPPRPPRAAPPARRRGHPARRAEGRRPAAAADLRARRRSGSRSRSSASGDAALARALRDAAALHPTSFAFVEGYDEPLSHLLLAGGDLLAHAEPLRALRPRADAGDALRDAARGHRRRRAARHRRRPRRGAGGRHRAGVPGGRDRSRSVDALAPRGARLGRPRDPRRRPAAGDDGGLVVGGAGGAVRRAVPTSSPACSSHARAAAIRSTCDGGPSPACSS